MAHCGLCFRDNDTKIFILNTGLGDLLYSLQKRLLFWLGRPQASLDPSAAGREFQSFSRSPSRHLLFWLQSFHFADAPAPGPRSCCQAYWPCISNAELHRLPLARYADSCNRRVSVSHVTLDLQRNCRIALSLPTKPAGRPSCLKVAVERARHKPNSRQSQLASAFPTDPDSPIAPGSGTAGGGFVFVFDVRQKASRKCRPIFYMSAKRTLIQPHGFVPKSEIYSVG